MGSVRGTWRAKRVGKGGIEGVEVVAEGAEALWRI